MEVKVFVDGVHRVVCGVTDQTSCQEVVIALAQALGRPGRYILKEKFKDFERCVSPNECLLESLQKYGEHVKEVQLTLLNNNRPPLLWDPAPGSNSSSRTTVPGDPLGPPLRRRRPDPGSRTRKGSGSLASSAHRQSLPVLSQLHQAEEEEGLLEDVKRPKRKSLTLMDAWGWLGSLGRRRLHYSVSEESHKETGKRSNENLLEGFVGSDSVGSGSVSSKEDRGQDGFLSRVRRRKRERQCREHRTSCCIGNQKREDDGQMFRKSSLGAKDGALLSKDQTLGPKDRALWTKDQTLGSKDRVLGRSSRAHRLEDENNKLREHITSQGTRLRDLHLQITSVDSQIGELEGQKTARQARLDAQQTSALEEEENEQVQFWENELKAELGYERDIQARFLEMRERAWQCKAQLEEYKLKVQRLDFTAGVKALVQEREENPGILGKGVTQICTGVETSKAPGRVNTGRKESPSQLHAPVPPQQIKERRLTGPTELREWWTHWSGSQATAAAPQTPSLHRAELTIYLGSARV
ncbi:hypothetical protein NHX12_012750 [Muraenolepis orangiensis]|uniref:Ras-associating domain-containing protein n=1 Tax=Muraenolepis orangiensis TaxID=630683 RepID=A0A9Q0DD19_9TELE|nr:hypothetical protein NHX12_012750 [Muraenolepis orangiensis]